ncbi:MAG: histidine kinase dimerization/phosphoacceptor domain -containing protein [Chitinophagaceae bacterium]
MFVFFGVRSQDMSNTNLGIITTDYKPVELFQQLHNTGKADSNKVKLLVSICSFKWYSDRNEDSVTMYAEKALKLSKQLGYQPGYNEAIFILAKNYLYNDKVSKAVGLLTAVPREQQARILLATGEYYLFQPGHRKENLDSACYYFSIALRVSKLVKSERMKHEALIALGKYYFSAGEFGKAKSSFMEIIEDLRRSGNRSEEANIWHELGIYMPDTDETFRDELEAHGNSLKIYHDLKDTANETSVLQDIAAVNMRHAVFDLSKTQLLEALHLRKVAGIKKLYLIYSLLAWVSHATGNLDESLSWALEAEKNAKELDAKSFLLVPYLLGMIYGDNGQAEKSLEYLLEIKDPADNWNFLVYSKIVEQYLNLNKPKEALSFIKAIEKETTPVRSIDKETLAAIKGDCYNALNLPSVAEKFYLQMIRLDKETQLLKSREVMPLFASVAGSEAYYKIGNFYMGQHNFNAARYYADRASQIHTFTGSHLYTSHLRLKIWLLKFRIDSSTGNDLAAIQHFEKYTALNDSIFTAKKSNHLLHLQVEYENGKKEDALKIKDKDIMVLNKKNQLQDSRLKQANFIKNVTTCGVILLFVIMGLLYNQYRHKKQHNKVITEKNELLQHLLAEKEWLLKEVHHRVKNNLHTVICLLESQAAYLESDARKANEISQQRIYAMSLIHQKIYQSEDIKKIDMSVYLPELIQYLDDSFGNNQQIHFDMDIDPVELDISQAVPVALTINEAVTNSIKYAFPGNRQGTIEITLHQTGDQVTLIIADNGIGIDNALINASSNSLGLQLIKGLSRDIKALVTIENINGTKISIVFNQNLINKIDTRQRESVEEGLFN